MTLRPDYSSNYLLTLRAIQQNFDLMSQAVQESERQAKENFFVNKFDFDQLVSTRSTVPHGVGSGNHTDSEQATSRISGVHHAEYSSNLKKKSRNKVAEHITTPVP